MISAVLDTNILASGIITSSTFPRKILNKWREGAFELIISEYILTELKRTLSKPYFRKQLKTDDMTLFLDFLRNEASVTPLIIHVSNVATHPEDDIVLATAESGKASYIVTGDHGLQNLKKFKNIQIVNPKTFAEILETENSV